MRRAIQNYFEKTKQYPNYFTNEDFSNICDDIKKEIEPWDINIKVSSKGYMLGYHLLDTIKINPLYRLLSTVGDNMMKMQIVRIDLIE